MFLFLPVEAGVTATCASAAGTVTLTGCATVVDVLSKLDEPSDRLDGRPFIPPAELLGRPPRPDNNNINNDHNNNNNNNNNNENNSNNKNNNN